METTDYRPLNICTLGQFGHGKTTLTAAIIQLLSSYGGAQAMSYDEIDYAPEEMEHGITTCATRIEYQTEGRRRHYLHIDCPSHIDYVKILITGAVRLDAAILVVSASDGPMPETREHILLCKRVGIPHIIVYLNKCDTVDDDVLMPIEEEIRELLHEYGPSTSTETPIVRGSAFKALYDRDDDYGVKSIEMLMKELDDLPDPISDIDSPFLMPVKHIMTITGRGISVVGRVESGKVKVGDEVDIVGLLMESRKAVVTGAQMINKDVSEAIAGYYASISLHGISKDDVEKGMVLAKVGSIRPYREFKAAIYVLKTEEGGRSTPFTTGFRLQFYFYGTDDTAITGEMMELYDADVATQPLEMAMPGDTICAKIELAHLIAMKTGLKFVIRSDGRTIGLGVVFEIL